LTGRTVGTYGTRFARGSVESVTARTAHAAITGFATGRRTAITRSAAVSTGRTRSCRAPARTAITAVAAIACSTIGSGSRARAATKTT
jgi:hypothetical protein